jgi:flagellar biosynthesis chaperone FliJ
MTGSFREFLTLQEMKKAYKIEIENKKAHLSNLVQNKLNVIEMLKEANMEYEKMLHLHEVELKNYAQLQRQKEAKNLDEIAVMLFNNKGHL